MFLAVYDKVLQEEVGLMCASLVTCFDKRHVVCGDGVLLPRGPVAFQASGGLVALSHCGILPWGLHVRKPCQAYWRSKGHIEQR